MKITPRNIYDVYSNILDRLVSNYIWYSTSKRHRSKKYKDINPDFQLNKSQIEQIDKFYIENFGKKIDHSAHREYSSFTGNFDPQYVPEYLFFSRINPYLNLNKSYVEVFEDKNVIPYIAKSASIKTPTTILSKTNGHFRNEINEIIDKNKAIAILQNKGRVFCKKSKNSSGGRGCFIANLKNGIDLGTNKTIESIFNELGNDFVIQKVVKCSKSIAKIYGKSVNTFRIVTYYWHGELFCMPAFIRVGCNNSVVDNVSSGGFFVPISDNGILHKYGYSEFGTKFEKHPNTNLVFDGYKIDNYKKVIMAAKKMHQQVPQVGIVFWDFTIDKDEDPLLIEANVDAGGIYVNQMSHGISAFENNTAEILQWAVKMHKASKKEKIALYSEVYNSKK